MANDITTLAIEIQSQEAERNLRTFNELLSLSSQTANKMEKVSIEVDVQAALEQLQALKAGYDYLSASAQNVNFDTSASPVSGAPTIDTEALNAIKEFFVTSSEMSKAFREEMEQFNEAVKKLEDDTMKVASAGGKNNSTMRGAATVSREYAAALKELLAAQKEMEKASAKADEDGRALNAADEDAAAVKKKLISAQRELKAVTEALNATHNGAGGDIISLSQKEENLKNRISELKTVYEETRNAAEKFNAKLEDSAAKADAASAKYKEIKAKVEAMPKDPMGGAAQSTETFAEKAKLCGGQLTKLARGFNSVAMMAGGAIPGVAGLGRAISMFGMVNPYVAAATLAIGASVAVYHEYNEIMQDTAVAARDMAAEQAKVAESFKKEAQERQGNLDRLSVLNSYENLYDVEKEESRKIVEKLTAAYKGLGIQYDALTGKVTNLAEVSKKMSEQDRQRLLEEQERTVEMARSAASTQLSESQRESIGWFKNLNSGFFGIDLPSMGMPSAQGYADRVYAYINGAKDIEDQLKRVNEMILELDKMRQKGGISAWGNDAKNFSEHLKKSREALLEYKKQSEIYKQIREDSGVGGGRSEEEISNSIRSREAKLQTAKNASRSAEEKYADNVAEIEKLIEKKQKLSDLDRNANAAEYVGKNITAAEALLDVETEITNRTRERLAYEKQLDALSAKIEAQKRLWNMDESGNIVGKKSDAEIRSDRDRQIEELQREISALSSNENQDALTKKKVLEAQIKLNTLQQERIADEDAAKAAQMRAEEAKRGLVIDQNGNIVREQDEQEIANALKAEIDAQRDKVAKLTQGTKERYEAEAELTKLLRQQYADQKKAQEKAQKEQQATNDAQKRAEEAKKGFVWDSKGNIVRKKNEAELQKEREAEIKAAKAKVAATKAGTKERYEAEAELRKLQAADFNAREKKTGGDGSLGMMKEEQKVNSNMVKAVNAGSTEAMALQARNFTRGADPEKKVETSLKEIEKLNREIRDFVQLCQNYLNDIQVSSNDIANKVMTI